MTVEAAISALFQPGERFELAAIHRGRIETAWFDDVENACRWARERNGRQHLYVVLNPVREELTGGRARAADVSTVRHLLIDCDPVGEGDTEDAHELALSVARWLDSLGVQPALVFSGRGWQVWVRHEPAPYSTELHQVRRRFVRGVASRFSTPRAKIDATGDEARLARLPGTRNLKTGVVAELAHPFGAALALVDLERLADELAPARPSPTATPSRPTPSGSITPEEWDFLQVESALRFLSPDLPHDEWLSVGMALHATGHSWAFHAWDSWSRTASRQDKNGDSVYPGTEALRRRWDSFSSGGGVGPGTLFALAGQAGWVWREEIRRLQDAGTIPRREPPRPPVRPVPPSRPPVSDLPAYPLHVWPEGWRTVIRAQAEVGLTDPSIPAAYASALLGALLGPEWRFRLGSVECRPIVWSVVVAPSAISGKSKGVAALRAAASALNAPRAEEHKAAKAAWFAQPKKDRDPAAEPRYRPRVLVDATMESLVRVLDASGGEEGVLYDKDELAGWLSSFDAYRGGGGGKDRADWLSLRGGESFDQVRVSRDPVHIPRTHVCLFGAIQPEKLSAFSLDEGDGLFSRIMWNFVPARTQFGFGPAFAFADLLDRLLDAAQNVARPRLDVRPGAVARINEHRARTDRAANALYYREGLSLASTVLSRASLYLSTSLALLVGADAVEDLASGVRGRPFVVDSALVERADALASYYVAHGQRAVSGVLRPKRSDEAQALGGIEVLQGQLAQVVEPGQALALTSAEWAERLGLDSPIKAGKRLRRLATLDPHGWSVGRARTSRGSTWRVARLP